MKSASVAIVSDEERGIELQPASLNIWDKKYRLKKPKKGSLLIRILMRHTNV